MFISIMTGGTINPLEISIPVSSIIQIEKDCSGDHVFPHRVYWHGIDVGDLGHKDGIASGLTSDSELQSLFLQSHLPGAMRFPVGKGERRAGHQIVERLLLTNGQQALVVEADGDLVFMLPNGGFGCKNYSLDAAGMYEDERIEARRRAANEADTVADVSTEADAALVVRQAPIKKMADDW
jgi:hypothetical protein